MKIVTLIITYLVGLVFLVFGSNYFLNFIPIPRSEGEVATYMMLLFNSKYLLFVKLLEIIGAVLLLTGFKRALGIFILLPITVNIVMFEVLIAHQPGIGILILVFNLFLVYAHREKFQGIWQ
jgi:putative oxidoreductase